MVDAADGAAAALHQRRKIGGHLDRGLKVRLFVFSSAFWVLHLFCSLVCIRCRLRLGPFVYRSRRSHLELRLSVGLVSGIFSQGSNIFLGVRRFDK